MKDGFGLPWKLVAFRSCPAFAFSLLLLAFLGIFAANAHDFHPGIAAAAHAPVHLDSFLEDHKFATISGSKTRQ